MLSDDRSNTVRRRDVAPSAAPLATNCESHRAETTATGKVPRHGEIVEVASHYGA